MTRLMSILLLSFLCFASSPKVFAQDGQNPTFLEALKLFQTKDYVGAEKNYVTLLEQNPQDPTLLTNLGLTEWELGKKGLALAYFRHALSVNPSFEPARKALSFSLTQFKPESPSHDVVAMEWIRENVLAGSSVWTFAIIHLFTFFGLFWALLSLAKKSNEKTSSASLLSVIGAFALLWILSLSLLLFKVIDGFKSRGTIVTSSVSLLALPQEGSVSLLEIKEGVEVVVKQSQKDWVLISFPGASSGWVPASSVYIHQKGL